MKFCAFFCALIVCTALCVPAVSASGECARLLAAAAAEVVPDAPYAVQVAFCAMLLNRRSSANYPDSLGAVISDAGIIPDLSAEPSPRLLRAACDAISGFDPTRGALCMLPPGAYPDEGDARLRFTGGGWCFY